MRVPTYDNYQTSVEAPNVRARNPLTPGLATITGDALQQRGQAVEQAGNALGQIVQDQQNEFNAVASNDAKNRALAAANALTTNKTQTGYQDKKGRDALPQDGRALSDVYGEQLSKSFSEIREGLANDAQKRDFDQFAGTYSTQFRASVDRHMASQFDVYQDSTNDAAMQVGADTISAQYQDADAVSIAINNIKGSAAAKARLAGQSETYGLALGQEKVAQALTGVVKTLVDGGKLQSASAFYELHKAEFPDGGLSIKLLLDNETELGTAQAAVASMSVVAQRAVAPTDLDQLVGAIEKNESGGRDFAADGSVLTSSKGARGRMQVMPSTARDPGHGIPPAKDDSPEEYARVGRALIPVWLRQFGGDPAKLVAAYNAGPERVKAAVQKDPVNWLSHLPAETQAYVPKVMADFQNGGGRPARLTELDAVNTALAALPANASPSLIAKTQQLARQQYAEIERSQKDKEDASLDDAYRQMASGTPFTSLPASLRAAVPQEKIPELMKFSEDISAGPKVKTDNAVYYVLSQNPDRLRDMSDAEFMSLKTKLDDSDFQAFAKSRASLRKGGGDNDPGNIDRAAMNSTLNPRLAQIGINTKTKNPDQAAHLGAIQKLVSDEVLRRQKYLGRQLNTEEFGKTVDDIMIRSVPFDNTLFGMKVGKLPARPLVAVDYKDLPTDTRNRITASLQKAGNPNPSKADVLAVYYAAHNK